MVTPYTEGAFAYRVDFAARVISAGRHIESRSFDTCFEMNDGDAVAVALYRRSRRNPKLRANLWRFIARDSSVKTAWANRRKSRAELTVWAAELRRQGREQFRVMMQRIEDEKTEKRETVIAAGYSVRPSTTPHKEFMWQYVRPDGTVSEDIHHEDNAFHWAHADLAKVTA
jgi:mannose-6-phosphate isomerase-like protein (cupin superfamily)